MGLKPGLSVAALLEIKQLRVLEATLRVDQERMATWFNASHAPPRP
ncbi:TPA: hypothetical protein HH295_04310 [Xanthomonas vasicola pv. zeae]|nr:hypothetical protein [Xanthomonas vasicola]MBV6746477.1 hypothetical protein [Xanthomonas vasicola pv. vasculorum NCPPB 890]MBV6891698.1 hypothetical protein [Xanthomonas vasicola pv. vasculorum]MBV7277767.1 hypothetical protein [Xanthomonas vasicola pv. musacearum]MBV7288338.1 hypothetical protein [Xanthomonas vasicola pv. musacearum]MDO6935167.1 hypothetical protein [Xanthomonas vasicola]